MYTFAPLQLPSPLSHLGIADCFAETFFREVFFIPVSVLVVGLLVNDMELVSSFKEF